MLQQPLICQQHLRQFIRLDDVLMENLGLIIQLRKGVSVEDQPQGVDRGRSLNFPKAVSQCTFSR